MVAWLAIILNVTCLCFSLAEIVKIYVVFQSTLFEMEHDGMMHSFFYTRDLLQLSIYQRTYSFNGSLIDESSTTTNPIVTKLNREFSCTQLLINL